MASIVSKLARASFATRASPSAVGGIAGGARPVAAIRVSPAGGPKSEEEEKTSSKSEVAPYASIIHPRPPLEDVDENVFKSTEAMWAFYEYWCKYHGILRDRREMERRFKTFSDTARFVHKINNSGVNGKAAMNKFADMTNKDFSPPVTYMHPRK